jgi:peptide/nickel transport system substrate-binding protein
MNDKCQWRGVRLTALSRPDRSKKPRRLAEIFAVLSCLFALASPSAPALATDLVVAVESLGTFEWGPQRNGDENAIISMHWSDPLVTVDPKTGQLSPGLAESWEISDDGKTWTFKLRPGVKFHDGWGTLTAEDVKYTWEQWIAPDTTHSSGQVLSQAIDGNMDNFEIVDDLTFKLHTTKPVVHLLALLCGCDTGLQVVPKKYHDEKGADAENTHPISTGPWKYVSGTPGVEVVLEAVKDHWRKPPAFDRLIYKQIDDEAARLVQIQSGAVDIASVDSSLIGEAKAAGLEIIPLPFVYNVFVVLGGQYWGADTLDRNSPWIQADNPEKGLAIRQAMSLAIDRQLIVDRILGGYGEINHAPLFQYNNNPDLTDPSWTVPEYNPEMAKQKLAEGGYPDGFPVTLFMYSDDVDLPGIAEAIAGMWESIGIKVNRMPGDEGILDEKLDKQDTAGLAWVKLAKTRPEPASTISNYRMANTRDYKLFHPAIEEGFPKLTDEPDYAKRFAIGREILGALKDDVTMITLFNAHLPIVVGPKVGGWSPSPGDPEINNLETATPK